MTFKSFVLLIGAMTFTGWVSPCAFVEKPRVANHGVNPRAPFTALQKKAIGSITVVRADQAPERAYTKLGKVSGRGCRNRIEDSALGAEDRAMQHLRLRAYRKSADAILGVSCASKGKGLGSRFCHEEVWCHGTALAFEASEGAGPSDLESVQSSNELKSGGES